MKKEKPKLQVALDVLTIEEALRIAKQVAEYADIIELGTPLLQEESTKEVLNLMRTSFPKKILLADLKAMDVGKIEASMAFEAGADIMTVCAGASDSTIKAALEYAKKHHKKIMVDLIDVKDKVSRAKEVEKLKPHYICVHTGIDEQHLGVKPFEDLVKISKIIETQIAVAGGINLNNMNNILKYKPSIIIVGSGITSTKNPALTAKKLKEKIEKVRKTRK